MMNHDPLKVDSNFFKDDSGVDSSKVLSYVQVTKKVDKSILIQKYYFGATKGFVKIKMNRAIDVKTRFASNGGKCDDDRASISICGVVVTNEKIRILNVNELASTKKFLVISNQKD